MEEFNSGIYSTVCFAISCVCGASYNSSNMSNWRVRDAVAEDVPDILRMTKVRNEICLNIRN